MAAISRSRRAAAGIAFIVAGAALLLAVLLPYVNLSLPFLGVIAFAAVAVGLVILALGAVNNTLAKVSLFAGALGWLILAIASVSAVLPAVVVTIGGFLAALGFLVGAVVLYTGREIVQVSGAAFVASAVLAVLLLLPRLGINALEGFSAIWTIALGVALVITGIYFRRTERRR
jgi:hypothetical protein